MKYLLLSLLLLCQNVNAHNIKQRSFTLTNQSELRASGSSANVLWVAGSKSTIYISLDQGRSWINRSITSETSLDFRDIAVFSDRHAIVMAAGNGKKSKLFSTQDQGVTWQLLYTNHEEKGFYNAIDFWDHNHGILFGDPTGDTFSILITQDGGKSWQKPVKLSNLMANEVAFAASGCTVLTDKKRSAWFTTGGFSASLYESHDRGQTWHKTALPLYQQTATSGGYCVAKNRQEQLFVLGGDYVQRDKHYNNMVSFDNQQWRAVTTSKNGLRTAMACHVKYCLATGKLSTDISLDDGKTWHPLLLEQGYYTLALAKNGILAAGKKGEITYFYQ